MRRRSHCSVSSAARLFLVTLALATAGCRGWPWPQPPIHLNPNMDYQEKAQPQEESAFFYDGMAMRAPVPGTVARGDLALARGDLALAREYTTGKDQNGGFLAAAPEPASDELLARGAERYTIYCSPCHDQRGTGQGILAEYAKVPTASFHDQQRAAYPDGQLFDIITNGSGLMTSYRYQLPPRDRWAIIAHVRALQNARRQQQTALAATAGGAIEP